MPRRLTRGPSREGFPDLFGEFFEYDVTSGANDWDIDFGACLGNRNLAEPHLSTSNTGLPAVYPEHASEFCLYSSQCDDLAMGQTDGHPNATIPGKFGQLLGRSQLLGAETHWGVSVTGIGMADTSSLFYAILTAYLAENATFTSLRESALSAARALFGSGSNEVIQVTNAVDAMGFWTSQAIEPLLSSTKMDGQVFLVNNETRRYVFGVDNGVLWYRYRVCALGGRCTWVGPTSVFYCDTGLSAAVFNGGLWIAFDYAGNVWTARMNSSGIWDVLAQVPGITTSVRPELVAVGSSALKVFVRQSGSLYTNMAVRVSTWSGTAWSATASTLFRVRSPLDCVTTGVTSKCIYRNNANEVMYRSYNHQTSAYGTEVLLELPGQILVPDFADVQGPTIALNRGRLNILVDHRPSWLYESGVWYGSAPWTCEAAECWTRLSPINGTSNSCDNGVDWILPWYLDGRLYYLGQNTIQGTSSVTWRWKNSE